MITFVKRLGWLGLALVSIGFACGTQPFAEQQTMPHSPEMYPLFMLGGWVLFGLLFLISAAGYIQAGNG